jgi:glycosyltransferase involved in cell wall biosynthesis
LAGNAGLNGGIWTALRMSELIGLRHEAAKRLFEQVDHVVAVSEWVRELLVRSGVPVEKLTLSRQGLPYIATQSGDGGPPAAPASAASRLRFAFLGRLDPVKGVEILIDALRGVPKLAVSLDIYAVVQGPSARDMEARLLRKAAGDPRVRFLPPMAASEVVERLRAYDALLVPSQWLETGPLVVYEAFAAGVPVIGSNLGGIAELVKDGENGILVEPHSVSAWTGAITRLVENPDLPVRLKSGRRPVRTMEHAAADMQTVYEKVRTRFQDPSACGNAR